MLRVEATGLTTHSAALPVVRGREGRTSGLVCGLCTCNRSLAPAAPASLRAARETGHISGLVSLLNAKTGEVQRLRPRCLLKGQSAVVEVTPARPICVEDYADYRVSGRWFNWFEVAGLSLSSTP